MTIEKKPFRKYMKKEHLGFLTCLFIIVLGFMTIPTHAEFIKAGFVVYWMLIMPTAFYALGFTLVTIATGD